MSISGTIKSIQDIMRKDVGVDGDAQRIGQLVWMLFLKIYDDRELEWELLGDHKSPIPEKYRWRNWAADPEGRTGEELKGFIDNELFPALQNLHESSRTPQAFVVRSVFEDAYNYMKSGQLIRQVINKIQHGVDFNKSQDRHAFGDMYEQLLRDLQSAGNAGEFYTPRPVTEFMVRMVDPKLAEAVMDPACGTGGFLTCSIEHKRRNYVKTADDERLLQTSFYGVEKKQLPHLLATTNMILHGIDVPSQIRHDNTLAKPLISWGPKDRVDCIVANPPFGGMEEDGIENNFPAAFRTRETADLFLVLIMHLLKPGGRAAVVLPDGFLFGEGIKSRIKEKLLTDCNLHTVVRLPNGVFNPYTGIKTNLLFFTKGLPTQHVWFYEHQYPAGVKNYSKTRPMRVEEFAVEEAWWGSEPDGFATRKENAFAWKVSVEELRARNWNLDCKNPHVGEQSSHSPEKLLREYSRMEAEVDRLRSQLKAELAEALEPTSATTLLTDNLPLLAGASNGIKELRELILELAVRGKLVPQNPSEESVEGLLGQVRAERVRLMAAGLIKKEKPAAAVGVDEQPFPLPDGWSWCRVVDTGDYINGLAFSSRDWSASGRPIIRIQNLSGRNQQFNRTLVDVDESIVVNEGDILVSWSATLDAYIWRGEQGVLNQHIFRVVPSGVVIRPYLYWLLKWVIRVLADSDHSHGLVMAHINRGPFLAQPIGLPSPSEQQRIVTKLQELMGLCDTLETQQTEAESVRSRLVQSVLGRLTHGESPRPPAKRGRR